MPETNLDSLRLTSGYLHKAATAKRMGLGTIPTTGVVISTMIAEYAGTLASVQFVTNEGLAANDTNYVIVSITNWAAGAGSVAMLAAGAGNGTQVTGGSALTAKTKRTLTLNATPANLAIAVGDTLAFAVTVSGTLGAVITGGSFLVTINPS